MVILNLDPFPARRPHEAVVASVRQSPGREEREGHREKRGCFIQDMKLQPPLYKLKPPTVTLARSEPKEKRKKKKRKGNCIAMVL